jgi:hypothetical protein
LRGVDKTTLGGSVYIAQGHPKWVILPDVYWEFDLGSQKWNERKSYPAKPMARLIGGCQAFGKWITLATRKAARLLYIDETNYTEVRRSAGDADRKRAGAELPEPDQGCAG